MAASFFFAPMLLFLFVAGVHFTGPADGSITSIQNHVSSNNNNNNTGSSVEVFLGPPPPCMNNIQINQTSTGYFPITYTANVTNGCSSEGGCPPVSNLQLGCGVPGTVLPGNSSLFRRVDFFNCLVNDGAPIDPTQTITFDYMSLLPIPYPFTISNITCM